jgi:hypothetical protein
MEKIKAAHHENHTMQMLETTKQIEDTLLKRAARNVVPACTGSGEGDYFGSYVPSLPLHFTVPCNTIKANGHKGMINA